MWHYLIDYGAFLLGVTLYMLAKIQEFKEMAEANPDPKIIYNTRHMFDKEWVNFVRLLIGGIALVWFMPMLIGNATVDIKNEAGAVITTLAFSTILLPTYFFVGYSGTSGLFAIFGKYKKTLLNRIGADDK